MVFLPSNHLFQPARPTSGESDFTRTQTQNSTNYPWNTLNATGPCFYSNIQSGTFITG